MQFSSQVTNRSSGLSTSTSYLPKKLPPQPVLRSADFVHSCASGIAYCSPSGGRPWTRMTGKPATAFSQASASTRGTCAAIEGGAEATAPEVVTTISGHSSLARRRGGSIVPRATAVFSNEADSLATFHSVPSETADAAPSATRTERRRPSLKNILQRLLTRRDFLHAHAASNVVFLFGGLALFTITNAQWLMGGLEQPW